MSIIDFRRLDSLDLSIAKSDNLHFLRMKDEMLLSNKGKASMLCAFYEDATILPKLKTKIDQIKLSVDTLFEKFATKQLVDTLYTSKETLENTIPVFLTHDNMDDMIAKYATEDMLGEKGAEARKEANRLADEMTDFAGAAMVGINQGGANEESATPTE